MLAICSVFITQAEQYLIESIEVTQHRIIITPHKAFSDTFLKSNRVQFDYEAIDLIDIDASIAAIPFVLCAAPAVWISGRTYKVKSMDKDLFYSLQRIKAVLQLFYPQFGWDGEISADTLINNARLSKDDEIGLLFSGGLDSVSASWAQKTKTQLLITNHGVDIPLNNETMWKNVQQSCKTFAQLYGHSNAFITFDYCALFNYEKLISNYGIVSKWWWLDNVVDALQHAGVTAPLLYKKGCTKLYIASSHTADFPYPYGSHPLIDNNIRFAGITFHHDQDMLTRSEKIELLASIARDTHTPLPRLRVCWSDKEGGNCLQCEKCLRTFNNILSQDLTPQDFGFALSVDEAMQRTKIFFKEGAQPIKDGRIAWEWTNIQKSTQKMNLQSHQLKAYVAWLQSLEIDNFYEKKVTYPESNRAYFTSLWNLGSGMNVSAALDPIG